MASLSDLVCSLSLTLDVSMKISIYPFESARVKSVGCRAGDDKLPSDLHHVPEDGKAYVYCYVNASRPNSHLAPSLRFSREIGVNQTL